MKRFFKVILCIILGICLVVGGSIGLGVFKFWPEITFWLTPTPQLPTDTPKAGMPTATISNTPEGPVVTDYTLQVKALPEDISVPQYYTTIYVDEYSFYAFTDANGNICGRAYGELEISYSDGSSSFVSGFFAVNVKDGSTLLDTAQVNPDAESFGIAESCKPEGVNAITGFVKLSNQVGSYYYINKQGTRVYRTYARIGKMEPVYYPADATGKIQPGALPVDILADRQAIQQEQETKYSVATAPYSMVNNVEFTTLINMNHRLDKNYVPSDMVSVSDYLSQAPFTLRDTPTKANATALQAFLEMVNAAYAEAGINSFYLCNVYRSYAKQTYNWNSQVNRDPSYGTNPSKPMGSAYPGTSEHQTGLAFDITSLGHKTPGPGYASTAEAKWLAQNAHRFGFILRYQKSKEKLTSIKYEPYHFRYVGTELADYLYQSDLCLEEYYDAVVVW